MYVHEEKLQEANFQITYIFFEIFSQNFSIMKLCNLFRMNSLINKHNTHPCFRVGIKGDNNWTCGRDAFDGPLVTLPLGMLSSSSGLWYQSCARPHQGYVLQFQPEIWPSGVRRIEGQNATWLWEQGSLSYGLLMVVSYKVVIVWHSLTGLCCLGYSISLLITIGYIQTD